MPSPMKQSVLCFSSPKKKTALSRSNAVEVVVIDDSDEDEGMRTPPPASASKPAKKNSGIVIELIKDHPRPYKVAQSSSSAATIDDKEFPKKKEVLPKKKKPSGDSAASSSSSLKPSKGEVLDAEASGSDRKICHHHRQYCSTLLRCTRE